MESFYKLPAIDEELKLIQKKHFKDIYGNKFSDDELDYKDDSYFYRDFFDDSTVSVEYDDTENDIDSRIYPSDKESVQEKITDDLEEYQLIYNLPDIDIKDKDWDTLFDIMHSLYIDMDRINYFYQDISKLNRLAISYVLLNDISYIGINSYINTIDYLVKELGKDGTIMLKNELNNKIGGKAKIINFNDYYNKKSKNINDN